MKYLIAPCLSCIPYVLPTSCLAPFFSVYNEGVAGSRSR